MKKIILITLPILIIIVAVIAILHFTSTDDKDRPIRRTQIRAELAGKSCLSIGQVVFKNEPSISGCRVIMVYNGNDCTSCVAEGFEMAKCVDSMLQNQTTYIVGIMTNQSNEQRIFNYTNYIFSDPDDLIRKELKYAPTPFMLLVDSKFIIRKAIFPGNITTKEKKEFIDNVVSKCKAK